MWSPLHTRHSKTCFPSLPPPQLGRNPCPLTLLHMGKEHLKRLNAFWQVYMQVPHNRTRVQSALSLRFQGTVLGWMSSQMNKEQRNCQMPVLDAFSSSVQGYSMLSLDVLKSIKVALLFYLTCTALSRTFRNRPRYPSSLISFCPQLLNCLYIWIYWNMEYQHFRAIQPVTRGHVPEPVSSLGVRPMPSWEEVQALKQQPQVQWSCPWNLQQTPHHNFLCQRKVQCY